MQISWNGLSSFVIKGKPIQGEVFVVTDPYQNSVGLRFPRTLSAAIVVQSHDAPEADNVGAISGNQERKDPFIVTHAGEFEVQGVFVTGIRAPKKDGTDHTIYRIRMEDMVVGFLGAIDRKLKDGEIEKLGDVDVLVVPVGGENVLGKETAAEVVNQVEPRLIVPSYYDVKGLKKEYADVEAFCKEISCPREDANKLKIKKNKLPVDEVHVRVLSRG